MENCSQTGKADLEKLILLINLGILHCLKNEYISINEAEYFLYTPFMMHLLEKNKYSENLTNIIHRGTELADLASFNLDVKDEVKKMLNDCEEMIKCLPESHFKFEKWYDQKLFDNYK